ncbi:hypothetical protein KSP39_PZI008140 [Platanthera zijinensis]|uniref:Uncharacterized protein n=1 Tax=Platanthera zijinensis TaxID=2320716 RepID=A0AAP0G962_9ASPA
MTKVSSIFLALNLRTRDLDRRVYDESDDDSLPATLPLLRKNAPSAPCVPGRNFLANNDSWIVRIRRKIFAANDDSWIVWIHDKVSVYFS